MLDFFLERGEWKREDDAIMYDHVMYDHVIQVISMMNTIIPL